MARRWAFLAWLPSVLCVAPADATGQRRLVAPWGDSLAFPEDTLVRMLDSTRALRRDMEEDPAVLYFRGTGGPATLDQPGDVYPWNAIEVIADSAATLRTPENLREAERAYVNYAVLRMRAVRGDPDVSCDSLFAREVRAVSGFVEGWIVARTLFGGPSFGPLDELAFAREAGRLPGLVAELGERQLGGCLRAWRDEHSEEVEAYRRWREETAGRGTNETPGPITDDPGAVGSRARTDHPRAVPRPRRARPTSGSTRRAWLFASTTR